MKRTSRKSRLRPLRALLAVLLAVCLLGPLCACGKNEPQESTAETTAAEMRSVPDVVGLHRDAAKAELESAGFSVRISEETNDIIAANM